jgi:hypothetical protein
MAISTGAAILGVAGIGAGLIGANQQKNAIKDASREQARASDANLALQRDIYEDNVRRTEPFRQLELQQANAYGEIFGFNPVRDGMSGPAPAGVGAGRTGASAFDANAYLTANPDVAQHWQGLSAQQKRSFPTPQSFAQYHYQTIGAGEGRPTGAAQPAAPAGYTDASGTVQTGQDAARSRFNESMFNDVYREGHARDTTKIDAGLSSQGLAFSGARTQAVEDSRADRFASTFNNYLATLMGSPPTGATGAQSGAASTFGANAGQIIQNQGDNAAQSAYAKGEVNAGIWNGVSQLGGYALAGGFGRTSSGGTTPMAGRTGPGYTDMRGWG